MIPPQLALFAAKHGKKLIYLAVFAAVLFTIWLAFSYHERVVGQNAQLRGELASVELARRVDAAKMEAQAGAIQQWKKSAENFQATLRRQEQVAHAARDERRNLDETFRENRLSRLAAAKPALVELAINRGTARMQRLLVCASTAGCDSSRDPGAAPEAEPSSSRAAYDGTVRVARASTGNLEGPRRSVLLREASGLRGSGQESSGDPSVHPRSHVAAGILPKGRS